MPGPSTADARILHDHFGAVVVDLAFEQFFRGVYDGFAARDHAVNRVAGMVPEGETDGAPFAIGAAEGVFVEGAVFVGGLVDEADFFGGEHAAGKDVAVAVVIADLKVGQGAGGHRAYGSAGRLDILDGMPSPLSLTRRVFLAAAPLAAAIRPVV